LNSQTRVPVASMLTTRPPKPSAFWSYYHSVITEVLIIKQITENAFRGGGRILLKA
jgi:hypothetical protein